MVYVFVGGRACVALKDFYLDILTCLLLCYISCMDDKTLMSLIRDCIQKQSEPCSALYKHINAITSQLVRRYTSSLSMDDIEDIIQTVNFKLVRSGLRRFNGKTVYEFTAYLNRITINEINSFFREKKIEITDYSDDLQTDPDPPSDNEPSKSRELMHKTYEVLKDYSPKEREAFISRILGYQYEEISQQFNIPISTLATRFEVIKQKIRDKLK